MPLGEMLDLEKLSQTCREKNRWTFFFTAAPANVQGKDALSRIHRSIPLLTWTSRRSKHTRQRYRHLLITTTHFLGQNTTLGQNLYDIDQEEHDVCIETRLVALLFGNLAQTNNKIIVSTHFPRHHKPL